MNKSTKKKFKIMVSSLSLVFLLLIGSATTFIFHHKSHSKHHPDAPLVGPGMNKLSPAILPLTPVAWPKWDDLRPAMNNLGPSTTIFTNERLHAPLSTALHNHLPTSTTVALLSKVNVYNVHKLGESHKTYASVNATVNVNGIYGSVIATVVYNADSGKFTFWNLRIVTNSNSFNPAMRKLTPAILPLTPVKWPKQEGLTPAINNLGPSTTIFTNERLQQPLTTALHNYLPTGTESQLLSKVNVYNIHKLGESHKAYADVNATVNVAGIKGSITATVVYNTDSNNFTFWNLHIVTNSNSMNPAINNLGPSTSIFTNEHLHAPLTTALHNYLPTGTESQLLSKVNVYNIHKLGESHKAYADVNATVNVAGIKGSITATVVYNTDSNNFTFWNLHIVTNSNSMNPAMNNLGPSIAIFTNEHLHAPLTTALQNYVPTNTTAELLSKVNVYNVHKQGESQKTYASVNATINVNGIYGSVIATAVYNADSNKFTFWNLHIVTNSNSLNPAMRKLTPAILPLTPVTWPKWDDLTPAMKKQDSITPAWMGFKTPELQYQIRRFIAFRKRVPIANVASPGISSISKTTFSGNVAKISVSGQFLYKTRGGLIYVSYYRAIITYNLLTKTYDYIN